MKKSSKIIAVLIVNVMLVSTIGMSYSFAENKEGSEYEINSESIIEDDKEEKELIKADKKQIEKDETVYVKAKSDGSVKNITVSEWLKNLGNDEINDHSILNNIENVKGEETFSEKGNEIKWTSKGKDIYYQGTTKKELPISVKISYELNGKKISAKELVGKSGEVNIRIKYTNKENKTVKINGKDEKVYVPFTMVTAMMLPIENYTNVEIDNGKVLSDGQNNIIIGIGFPGLRDNIKTENEDIDIDIPSEVNIKADVVNATIKETYTVASTEILSEFDIDGVGDMNKLRDSINKLLNSATKLEDGSKSLRDGLETLNSKSKELSSGVNELTNGIKTYTDGVGKVADGSLELKGGNKQIVSGAKEINQGLKAAYNGSNELVKGYKGKNGALSGAKKISEGLSSVSKALTANKGTGISKEQIEAVAKQTANNATEAAIAKGVITKEQGTICKSIYETAYIQALTGVVSNVDKGIEENQQNLKGAINQLKVGSDSLYSGMNKLYAGTVKLKSGLNTLKKGSNTLSQGASKAYNGACTLNNALNTLKSNNNTIVNGMNALENGGTQLVTGVNKLTLGSIKLNNGLKEFNKSGMKKIADLFNSTIENISDRMDEIVKVGKEYQSFAGINEEMEGSTKFIIVTEGN